MCIPPTSYVVDGLINEDKGKLINYRTIYDVDIHYVS